MYREVDVDELAEDGGGGAVETWNEQTYQHVDVIAADRVFTDNTDAVVNTETRSVPVTPGHSRQHTPCCLSIPASFDD